MTESTKRPVGQPPKPPGERRDHVARVPMSEAEQAAADRVRERLGYRTIAAMVRGLIARADKRAVKSAAKGAGR